MPTGRKSVISDWAEKALEKRLQEEQNFNSYGEIGQWLLSELGIEAKYKTVHRLVLYKLKASLKQKEKF